MLYCVQDILSRAKIYIYNFIRHKSLKILHKAEENGNIIQDSSH